MSMDVLLSLQHYESDNYRREDILQTKEGELHRYVGAHAARVHIGAGEPPALPDDGWQVISSWWRRGTHDLLTPHRMRVECV